MPAIDLTKECCRSRQGRLLERMKSLDLDRVILSSNENIQWLTGYRPTWFFKSFASIDRDGVVALLAAHRKPGWAAADVVDRYDAKWHSTLRNDQRAESTKRILDLIGKSLDGERIGVEFAEAGLYLTRQCKAEFSEIDPVMYELRRVKETDELGCLRFAISATEKMYECARNLIKPGVSELEVFNALQSTAVEHLGEMLTGTGNDYQCASRGGPPRGNQFAQAGELYILDLGPAYRGYFADNARTIAVAEPTDSQLSAWEQIQHVFRHVEANVKPGKSCKELFQEAQAILDEAPCGEFNHHLGHGIGLFPHEAPHLNPHWDDTFQLGEVFTVEPGLYGDDLNHGMRLENDYLVTETGVENLSPFPLDL